MKKLKLNEVGTGRGRLLTDRAVKAAPWALPIATATRSRACLPVPSQRLPLACHHGTPGDSGQRGGHRPHHPAASRPAVTGLPRVA